MVITLTRGLPAAGKSTWAKAQVLESKGGTKRVAKDDLRDQIDAGKWTRHNEEFILRIRNAIIFESVRSGKNVIVDDTNLCEKHLSAIQDIARSLRIEKHNVTVEVKDFTDVSVDECIERDLKRARSVGAKVITDMYNKYLRPKPEVQVYDPTLPDCIIIDIDGTIAINDGHRGWFDEDKVYDDKPHQPVIDAIYTIIRATPALQPIFVSGRTDSCREQTENFICRKTPLADIQPIELFMRKTGDTRCDTIVKRELYEAHIKGHYNVKHAWDDRPKVIRAWKQLGIPVFNVGSGEEF